MVGTARCAFAHPTPGSPAFAGDDSPLRRDQLLNLEQLTIPFLDLFALLLDRDRVLLQSLDLLEGLAAGLFLGLRMQRAQRGDVDDELLALRAERPVLKQPRGVRI